MGLSWRVVGRYLVGVDGLGLGTSVAAVLAFDFVILGLDLGHGFRLELLGFGIHAYEQAPGRQDRRGGQADRGRMRQEFGFAMHELEYADQGFHRQRDHHHDQEARQETTHAGRRADIRGALDFFFQHRLAELEGSDGDGQQANALQQDFKASAYWSVDARVERIPGFDCGQDNQADAAGKEEGDNQQVSDEENS